jgi:hypothetical protein
MNCQECDKILRNKRSDAKFCSHNCKVKFNNRKKQQQVTFSERQKEVDSLNKNRINEVSHKLAILAQEIKPIKVELAQLIRIKNYVPLQIEILKAEITEIEEDIEGQLDEIALDSDSFYELHFEEKETGKVEQYHWMVNSIVNLTIKGLDHLEKAKMVEQAKEKITGSIEEFTQEIKAKKNEINGLEKAYLAHNSTIKKYLKQVQLSNERIEKLRVEPVHPKQQAAVPKREIPRQKKLSNGIGGADLLNMTFDTFRLNNELGRFLGELDRNMTAFALTGDSGAGKSYFSFELAKVFIDYGFSCKYYSMEEGLGKLTQDKLKAYDLGNDITLCANATLNEVRKDAKSFDLIIIDSFQKLNAKSDEFEKLRQDFPETVFIIIFQKTTAGTMRGGSSIKFNSSANIDVQLKDGERIAVMEKGRYGTIGWVYSISESCLIKSES